MVVRGFSVLLFGLLLSACQERVQENSSPLVGMRLNTVLGASADQGFRRADAPRTFRFPIDHGPHDNFRSEWWYLTAVMQDPQGHDYGLHFTLFKQALTSAGVQDDPWRNGLVYLAHLAITDVEGNRHFQDQRFSRGHPQSAGVSVTDGFRAWIEDWQLKGSVQDELALSLQAKATDFQVDLSFMQNLPVVLQGDAGLSHKGPDAASYYYSIPRMAVQGRVAIGGEWVTLSGLAWLDREWSTSVLPEGVAGWDWFALQLNDERSLMAFRLRREDGQRDAFDHGIEVLATAEQNRSQLDSTTAGVRMLYPGDYELTPQAYWRDEDGYAWPVRWQMRLGDEVLNIRALVDDQRMDKSIVYWEGIVAVDNAEGENLGRGYMELTGYNTTKRNP